MFRFATAMAMVGISLLMLHGPRASVYDPMEQLRDANVWQPTTGPDPGGRSATQLVPAHPPDRVASTGRLAEACDKDNTEYQAERHACESLTGDARNHCLEYAKLRYGRR
jgi:hypothetical protein